MARFDNNVKAAEIFAGDRVLVRNVNIREKHKLANRWKRKIHAIVKWIGDSPVYMVKPETGEGLHHVGSCLWDSSVNNVSILDQGDELYSDEDELYPSLQVPETITRGTFIQRQEIAAPVISFTS